MSEHTQVASYALGLLDPIEMTNFEIHLADCDECADQLEWLLPVAGQLSEVEPGDLYGVSGPSAFTVSGTPPPQQQSLPGGRNSQAAPPTSPTPFPPSRGAHTGEIPTTEGQASGRRSMAIHPSATRSRNRSYVIQALGSRRPGIRRTTW